MPVTSIGDGCFNGKYSYYGATNPHPNAENNNKITKVTVPSSVKTIYYCAFGCMENLNEVVLNEGLETIKSRAFDACPKLYELNLPDSLVSFTIAAVNNTPITELVFGTNLKSVDIKTFENSYLKRIVFNADVITIKNIDLDPDKGVLDEIICNGKLELDTYFNITNKKLIMPERKSWKAIIPLAFSQTAVQYFFYYIGVANATGVKAAVLSGSSSPLFFQKMKYC